MAEERTATIRAFGCLHDLLCEREEPTTVHLDVPEEGLPASEIARQLGLPLDLIEGVFCNGTVYPVEHVVLPGDRAAFVPYGTPGPHRFSLGLYAAGKVDTNAR
ncbi:MAG: hypothetical protein FD171_1945 [Actinobacteria bacterium]|nr:MAG: hypothetical protein FD171_1945 [Actinomycetota bacterium]